MNLLLVEKNNKRYVGESPKGVTGTDIELLNVYELIRAQVMTQQGPQLQHGFLPVGIDGPEPWTICNPDGFRVVADADPITKGYQGARAQDSGITLAKAMPGQLPGMPKGLKP